MYSDFVMIISLRIWRETSCFICNRYLAASLQYGLVNFEQSILQWRQRPILRFIATFLLFHGHRMPLGPIHLQKSNIQQILKYISKYWKYWKFICKYTKVKCWTYIENLFTDIYLNFGGAEALITKFKVKNFKNIILCELFIFKLDIAAELKSVILFSNHKTLLR